MYNNCMCDVCIFKRTFRLKKRVIDKIQKMPELLLIFVSFSHIDFIAVYR